MKEIKRSVLTACCLALTGVAATWAQPPVPQISTPTPVAPEVAAAENLKYTPTRITGKIDGLTDSSARTVQFYLPDLSDRQGTMVMLDPETDTFEFQTEIPCAGLGFFSYNDTGVTAYFMPGDTLHIEFDAAEFYPESTKDYPSLTFTGRSAEVNRHLKDYWVFRTDKYYPMPTGATPEEFIRSQDSLTTVYMNELDRYTEQYRPPQTFIDIQRVDITTSMAGYTWYPLIMERIPWHEADKLYRDRPFTIDERYIAEYGYYLNQVAQLPIWTDTTLQTSQAKNARRIEILENLPQSGHSPLVGNMMALQLLGELMHDSAAYFAAKPRIDTYLSHPAFRKHSREKGEEKYAVKPIRNVHALELPDENYRFLTELFAPYKESGKVLYVDIWGIGCGPCYQETPHAIELHKKMEGQDVEFIFISVSSQQKHVDEYLAQTGLGEHGTHILLNKDQSNMLMNYFGLRGIPHYWLIDREGNMVDEDAGRPSWEEGEHMRRAIEALLDK